MSEDVFTMLRRRRVITTDPTERDECCGLPRDDDGFCIHRPGHPIYLAAPTTTHPASTARGDEETDG